MAISLIGRLSGRLRKSELFMGCSVCFKYTKNALAARAPPRTPRRSPRLPSRLGRGTPVPMPHPTEKRVAAENFAFCIQ